MFLFRIWLTLIDISLNSVVCASVCLKAYATYTAIRKKRKKTTHKQLEQLFSTLHPSQLTNNHIHSFKSISHRNKQFMKMSSVTLRMNFYKIRKFRIHIHTVWHSSVCFLRWMNQHTWLEDMMAEWIWLAWIFLKFYFNKARTYAQNYAIHFRNGTFCRHKQFNLISFVKSLIAIISLHSASLQFQPSKYNNFNVCRHIVIKVCVCLLLMQ